MPSGTSNLLQWNPNKVNMETDAQYLADAQRTGGAGVDSVFASLLANKVFYQLSTFCAAYAQMMANKGYDVSDADFGTLVGVLSNALTNADIKPPIISVPFSATPTFDASTADGFYISLSANVTSSQLISVPTFQAITFLIAQGTGNHTFAWPTNVLSPGTVDPTANTSSMQQFIMFPDGFLRPITPLIIA